MFRHTTTVVTSSRLSEKLPRVFREPSKPARVAEERKCLTVTERCVPARRSRKRRDLIVNQTAEPVRGTWF